MPTKEVSVDEILPAELLYQKSLPERVLDWTEQLVTCLQDDYNRRYGESNANYKFEIQTGRKYHKIVAKNQGVHAFVNKTTGEVFKPASYKAPAKHVRYDLRRIQQRRDCFAKADWAGGYVYLRP